jgi:hypothetical protein
MFSEGRKTWVSLRIAATEGTWEQIPEGNVWSNTRMENIVIHNFSLKYINFWRLNLKDQLKRGM